MPTSPALAQPEPKRKVSVSLDQDLVAYLERDEAPLSVQVNEAVRLEVQRRQNQEALDRFCDAYEEANGPWDSQDEAEIQRIMRLLGG